MAKIGVTCPDCTADNPVQARAMLATVDLGEFHEPLGRLYGLGVSLEWERDAGETQIVVAERRAARHLGCPVPDANAGEAFHDPFRYGP